MKTILPGIVLAGFTIGAPARDKRPDYGTVVNVAGAKKIAAGGTAALLPCRTLTNHRHAKAVKIHSVGRAR